MSNRPEKIVNKIFEKFKQTFENCKQTVGKSKQTLQNNWKK